MSSFYLSTFMRVHVLKMSSSYLQSIRACNCTSPPLWPLEHPKTLAPCVNGISFNVSSCLNETQSIRGVGNPVCSIFVIGLIIQSVQHHVIFAVFFLINTWGRCAQYCMDNFFFFFLNNHYSLCFCNVHVVKHKFQNKSQKRFQVIPYGNYTLPRRTFFITFPLSLSHFVYSYRQQLHREVFDFTD